jgi:hypothetical protein
MVPLTAFLLLTACQNGDFRAEAALSETVSTVATVEFDWPEAGTAWVEWGPSQELGHTTVPGRSAGPRHTVLLAGLPTKTPVVARAVLEVDGVRYRSDTFRLRTGDAPDDLPDVEVNQDVDAPAPTLGYAVTTSIGIPSSVVIYDQDGSPVWWHQPDGGFVVTQAYVDDSGTEVWLNLANVDFNIDAGAVRRVRLDGTVLEEFRTPLSHHDFVRRGDGDLSYLAVDLRDVQGVPVVGDALVEVTDGESRTVWSAFDSFDPSGLDPADDSGFYPQGFDWTHCNSFVEDPAGGYTVSIRNLSRVVRVVDGAVDWSIGGPESLAPVEVTRGLSEQHAPSWTEEGTLLLFDNGDATEEGAYSRVVEYEVDPAAGTYRERWSFDDDRRRLAYLLGDVERMPESGHTLVAWGSAGVLQEVDDASRVVWQLETGIGHALAFSRPVPLGPCVPGSPDGCRQRSLGGVP